MAVIFGEHEVTSAGFVLNRLEHPSAATVRGLANRVDTRGISAGWTMKSTSDGIRSGYSS